MIEDLVRYLIRSGWVYQSVETVRPELPRWVRRLRERGVTSVPNLADRDQWHRWEYTRACNEVNLLLSQAAGDQATAHLLRNLTGVRPFKA